MADKNPRRYASIGEHLPSGQNGPSLEDAKLEGMEVIINAVAFESRKGQQGEYTLSVITLEDGIIVHTGSSVIAEQLGSIEPRAFPLRAMFLRVKSRSNPRYSYWSVVDPDNAHDETTA